MEDTEMMGGKVQLAVYGVGDQHLTGKPTTSYYQSMYKKHTNFAMDSKMLDVISKHDNIYTYTLDNKLGDLVTDCWLEFETKPNIEMKKGESLLSLIEKVQLKIGDKVIETFSGDWLRIWSELSLSSEKKTMYDKYVNQTDKFMTESILDCIARKTPNINFDTTYFKKDFLDAIPEDTAPYIKHDIIQKIYEQRNKEYSTDERGSITRNNRITNVISEWNIIKNTVGEIVFTNDKEGSHLKLKYFMPEIAYTFTIDEAITSGSTDFQVEILNNDDEESIATLSTDDENKFTYTFDTSLDATSVSFIVNNNEKSEPIKLVELSPMDAQAFVRMKTMKDTYLNIDEIISSIDKSYRNKELYFNRNLLREQGVYFDENVPVLYAMELAYQSALEELDNVDEDPFIISLKLSSSHANTTTQEKLNDNKWRVLISDNSKSGLLSLSEDEGEDEGEGEGESTIISSDYIINSVSGYIESKGLNNEYNDIFNALEHIQLLRSDFKTLTPAHLFSTIQDALNTYRQSKGEATEDDEVTIRDFLAYLNKTPKSVIEYINSMTIDEESKNRLIFITNILKGENGITDRELDIIDINKSNTIDIIIGINSIVNASFYDDDDKEKVRRAAIQLLESMGKYINDLNKCLMLNDLLDRKEEFKTYQIYDIRDLRNKSVQDLSFLSLSFNEAEKLLEYVEEKLQLLDAKDLWNTFSYSFKETFKTKNSTDYNSTDNFTSVPYTSDTRGFNKDNNLFILYNWDYFKNKTTTEITIRHESNEYIVLDDNPTIINPPGIAENKITLVIGNKINNSVTLTSNPANKTLNCFANEYGFLITYTDIKSLFPDGSSRTLTDVFNKNLKRKREPTTAKTNKVQKQSSKSKDKKTRKLNLNNNRNKKVLDIYNIIPKREINSKQNSTSTNIIFNKRKEDENIIEQYMIKYLYLLYGSDLEVEAFKYNYGIERLFAKNLVDNMYWGSSLIMTKKKTKEYITYLGTIATWISNESNFEKHILNNLYNSGTNNYYYFTGDFWVGTSEILYTKAVNLEIETSEYNSYIIDRKDTLVELDQEFKFKIDGSNIEGYIDTSGNFIVNNAGSGNTYYKISSIKNDHNISINELVTSTTKYELLNGITNKNFSSYFDRLQAPGTSILKSWDKYLKPNDITNEMEQESINFGNESASKALPNACNTYVKDLQYIREQINFFSFYKQGDDDKFIQASTEGIDPLYDNLNHILSIYEDYNSRIQNIKLISNTNLIDTNLIDDFILNIDNNESSSFYEEEEEEEGNPSDEIEVPAAVDLSILKDPVRDGYTILCIDEDLLSANRVPYLFKLDSNQTISIRKDWLYSADIDINLYQAYNINFGRSHRVKDIENNSISCDRKFLTNSIESDKNGPVEISYKNGNNYPIYVFFILTVYDETQNKQELSLDLEINNVKINIINFNYKVIRLDPSSIYKKFLSFIVYQGPEQSFVSFTPDVELLTDGQLLTLVTNDSGQYEIQSSNNDQEIQIRFKKYFNRFQPNNPYEYPILYSITGEPFREFIDINNFLDGTIFYDSKLVYADRIPILYKLDTNETIEITSKSNRPINLTITLYDTNVAVTKSPQKINDPYLKRDGSFINQERIIHTSVLQFTEESMALTETTSMEYKNTNAPKQVCFLLNFQDNDEKLTLDVQDDTDLELELKITIGNKTFYIINKTTIDVTPVTHDSPVEIYNPITTDKVTLNLDKLENNKISIDLEEGFGPLLDFPFNVFKLDNANYNEISPSRLGNHPNMKHIVKSRTTNIRKVKTNLLKFKKQKSKTNLLKSRTNLLKSKKQKSKTNTGNKLVKNNTKTLMHKDKKILMRNRSTKPIKFNKIKFRNKIKYRNKSKFRNKSKLTNFKNKFNKNLNNILLESNDSPESNDVPYRMNRAYKHVGTHLDDTPINTNPISTLVPITLKDERDFVEEIRDYSITEQGKKKYPLLTELNYHNGYREVFQINENHVKDCLNYYRTYLPSSYLNNLQKSDQSNGSALIKEINRGQNSTDNTDQKTNFVNLARWFEKVYKYTKYYKLNEKTNNHLDPTTITEKNTLITAVKDNDIPLFDKVEFIRNEIAINANTDGKYIVTVDRTSELGDLLMNAHLYKGGTIETKEEFIDVSITLNEFNSYVNYVIDEFTKNFVSSYLTTFLNNKTEKNLYYAVQDISDKLNIERFIKSFNRTIDIDRSDIIITGYNNWESPRDLVYKFKETKFETGSIVDIWYISETFEDRFQDFDDSYIKYDFTEGKWIDDTDNGQPYSITNGETLVTVNSGIDDRKLGEFTDPYKKYRNNLINKNTTYNTNTEVKDLLNSIDIYVADDYINDLTPNDLITEIEYEVRTSDASLDDIANWYFNKYQATDFYSLNDNVNIHLSYKNNVDRFSAISNKQEFKIEMKSIIEKYIIGLANTPYADDFKVNFIKELVFTGIELEWDEINTVLIQIPDKSSKLYAIVELIYKSLELNTYIYKYKDFYNKIPQSLKSNNLDSYTGININDQILEGLDPSTSLYISEHSIDTVNEKSIYDTYNNITNFIELYFWFDNSYTHSKSSEISRSIHSISLPQTTEELKQTLINEFTGLFEGDDNDDNKILYGNIFEEIKNHSDNVITNYIDNANKTNKDLHTTIEYILKQYYVTYFDEYDAIIEVINTITTTTIEKDNITKEQIGIILDNIKLDEVEKIIIPNEYSPLSDQPFYNYLDASDTSYSTNIVDLSYEINHYRNTYYYKAYVAIYTEFVSNQPTIDIKGIISNLFSVSDPSINILDIMINSNYITNEQYTFIKQSILDDINLFLDTIIEEDPKTLNNVVIYTFDFLNKFTNYTNKYKNLLYDSINIPQNIYYYTITSDELINKLETQFLQEYKILVPEESYSKNDSFGSTELNNISNIVEAIVWMDKYTNSDFYKDYKELIYDLIYLDDDSYNTNIDNTLINIMNEPEYRPGYVNNTIVVQLMKLGGLESKLIVDYIRLGGFGTFILYDISELNKFMFTIDRSDITRTKVLEYVIEFYDFIAKGELLTNENAINNVATQQYNTVADLTTAINDNLGLDFTNEMLEILIYEYLDYSEITYGGTFPNYKKEDISRLLLDSDIESLDNVEFTFGPDLDFTISGYKEVLRDILLSFIYRNNLVKMLDKLNEVKESEYVPDYDEAGNEISREVPAEVEERFGIAKHYAKLEDYYDIDNGKIQNIETLAKEINTHFDENSVFYFIPIKVRFYDHTINEYLSILQDNFFVDLLSTKMTNGETISKNKFLKIITEIYYYCKIVTNYILPNRFGFIPIKDTIEHIENNDMLSDYLPKTSITYMINSYMVTLSNYVPDNYDIPPAISIFSTDMYMFHSYGVYLSLLMRFGHVYEEHEKYKSMYLQGRTTITKQQMDDVLEKNNLYLTENFLTNSINYGGLYLANAVNQYKNTDKIRIEDFTRILMHFFTGTKVGNIYYKAVQNLFDTKDTIINKKVLLDYLENIVNNDAFPNLKEYKYVYGHKADIFDNIYARFKYKQYLKDENADNMVIEQFNSDNITLEGALKFVTDYILLGYNNRASNIRYIVLQSHIPINSSATINSNKNINIAEDSLKRYFNNIQSLTNVINLIFFNEYGEFYNPVDKYLIESRYSNVIEKYTEASEFINLINNLRLIDLQVSSSEIGFTSFFFGSDDDREQRITKDLVGVNNVYVGPLDFLFKNYNNVVDTLNSLPIIDNLDIDNEVFERSLQYNKTLLSPNTNYQAYKIPANGSLSVTVNWFNSIESYSIGIYQISENKQDGWGSWRESVIFDNMTPEDYYVKEITHQFNIVYGDGKSMYAKNTETYDFPIDVIFKVSNNDHTVNNSIDVYVDINQGTGDQIQYHITNHRIPVRIPEGFGNYNITVSSSSRSDYLNYEKFNVFDNFTQDGELLVGDTKSFNIQQGQTEKKFYIELPDKFPRTFDLVVREGVSTLGFRNPDDNNRLGTFIGDNSRNLYGNIDLYRVNTVTDILSNIVDLLKYVYLHKEVTISEEGGYIKFYYRNKYGRKTEIFLEDEIKHFARKFENYWEDLKDGSGAEKREFATKESLSKYMLNYNMIKNNPDLNDYFNKLTVDDLGHKSLTFVSNNIKDIIRTPNVTNKIFYVPLKFFFSGNLGSALPLASINDSSPVEISISFNKMNGGATFMTRIHNDNTKPYLDLDKHINEVNMYVNTVHLADYELKEFFNTGVSRNILIEQTHQIPYIHGRTDISIKNEYNNNPVKEIIWVYQKSTDKWGYYNSDGTDPFTKATITLDGYKRFTDRNPEYFKFVQPYEHHTRVPSMPIYVYSFAIKPEELQPSGTCNFERMDNVELKLTNLNTKNNDKIIIFTRNYNMLNIEEGNVTIGFNHLRSNNQEN